MLPERPPPKTMKEVLNDISKEIITIEVKLKAIKYRAKVLHNNAIIGNGTKKLFRKLGFVKGWFN